MMWDLFFGILICIGVMALINWWNWRQNNEEE